MKKTVSLLIAALMLLGVCVACGSGTPASSSVPPASTVPATSASSGTTSAPPAEPDSDDPFAAYGMPIVDEKITLSVFHRFDNAMWSQFQDFNESDFIQFLEEVTNIHIDFVVPPSGEENATLNLLISTRQLPDIIQLNLNPIGGGPGKLIDDGVIIRMNELMDEYAPNWMNLVNSNEEIRKRTMLDDGTRWGTHTISPNRVDLPDGTSVGNPAGVASKGPIYNYDLVKAAGFDRAPETIDDYYQMGKALVDMGVTPFFELPEYLAGAWGFILGDPWSNNEYWNIQGDKYVYAPMLDAYYDYLTTMRQWYAEGIIHPEYPAYARSDDLIENAIKTRQMAFYNGYSELGITNHINALRDTDPIDLRPAPWPGNEKYPNGLICFPDYTSAINYWSCSISADNKYPVESMKWLDFGYSDIMHDMMAWGFEGEDWTLGEDGERYFTEPYVQALQGKHPDGLTFAQLRIRRSLSAWWGNVKDPRAHYYKTVVPGVDPNQEMLVECLKTWNQGDISMLAVPISMNGDDATEFNNIANEVYTFAAETRNQWIMGQKPLNEETWQQYLDTLKSLGIERALEIRNAALDRYNAR